MISTVGKQKRVDRILKAGHKAFIVPVDDLLISGVSGQLLYYQEKIPLLNNSAIDAVLGFPGVLNQFYSDLHEKAWIINLTTSTILNSHTDKRLSLTLENAILSGCDAVAVHVNFTSPQEGEMIRNLATVSCECQKFGIPLLAIAYPRKPDADSIDNNYLVMKSSDIENYTRLVAHSCRVATELGADIIKTTYTGTTDSFRQVIYAAGGIPVIIAGGELTNEEVVINNVRGAIEAGASGICFGRNFFYRTDISAFTQKIRGILDDTR